VESLAFTAIAPWNGSAGLGSTSAAAADAVPAPPTPMATITAAIALQDPMPAMFRVRAMTRHASAFLVIDHSHSPAHTF
jgi:hypothetical protein